MGALDDLARDLAQLKEQQTLAKRPQLAFTSLQPEGDAQANIPQYDADGNLKTIWGEQFDGGNAFVVTSDPEPLQPSPPLVFPGPGTITARWDGIWCNEDGIPDETIPVPTWHSRVEVHASQDPDFIPLTAATLKATIETPRGGEVVMNFPSGGAWYIKLVGRSLGGNWGPASAGVFAEPGEVLDPEVIDDAISTRLSASGLAQIVSNDVEPPEPADGWTTGAIWWQTEGPGAQGNTVSWHRWDGSAWVEQQIDEQFLPLVNIGTGTFGNLSGDRISLSSVDPNRLTVGTDELIRNPRWMDPAYEAQYGPTKVYTDNANTVLNTTGWSWDSNAANLRFGQPHQIIVNGSAGNTGIWQHMPLGPHFPAFGGEKFVIAFDTFGGSATGYVALLLVPFDKNGNRITGAPININSSTSDPDRTWTSRNKVITMPNGTVSAQAWLEKQGTAGTFGSGYVMVGQVSIRRAMATKGPSGNEMELSGLGVRLFDADGSEVVSLTSEPPNYLSIRNEVGDTIANIGRLEIGDETGVYEGVVAADNLNIQNDPVFMGTPLLGDLVNWESPASAGQTGLLDALPRGIVARGYNPVMGRSVTSGEMEFGEISFNVQEGRMYAIHIEPIGVYVDASAYGYINIRQTTNGSAPTMSSGLVRRFPGRPGSSGGNPMLTFGGTIYHYFGAGVTKVRMLFSFEVANGTATVFNSGEGGDLRVLVHDVGPLTEDVIVNRTGKTSAPVPPPPEIKNYTKTYAPTGYRSYYTSGGYYAYMTTKMFQGNSPAAGGLQSIATFPSMTGDLSGATITSVKVYFYFEHWYYNSGGTARIHLHGASSIPSSKPSMTYAVSSSSWPKPGGRWVSIPSSFWNGFKSGTYRGVGLGDTSPTTTEYGYAAGYKTRIEIKYKK